jgi:predicted kinase
LAFSNFLSIFAPELRDKETIFDMETNNSMNKSIDNQFNMYMMIGLPGSGKDTFISTYLKDIEVICRDSIREELTDGQILGRKLYLDKEGEDKVTETVYQRINDCCKQRKSFVINQTNINKEKRLEIRDYAINVNIDSRPKVIYIEIKTDSFETCIERRNKGIWVDIINKMNDNYQRPTEEEYDEYILNYQK